MSLDELYKMLEHGTGIYQAQLPFEVISSPHPHVSMHVILVWLLGSALCICRRDVLQPLSEQGGSEGCRVIAFDRPPYGLSERPLSWPAGPEGNPYTSEVFVLIYTAYVSPSVAVPAKIVRMLVSDVVCFKHQHCCT